MMTTARTSIATLPARRRLGRALIWTAVTAVATAAIAWVSIEAVSPGIRRGGQPSSAMTLSYAWYAAYLLCVPVYLAARSSALLALPAVAVAMVPQFFVATVGLDRINPDDGLEALIYLVPILMSMGCLMTALIGAVLRIIEVRRDRRTRAHAS
jgi:hypothetical protein